ncbi:MAG: alkene reductase, partial [Gammaproteobacteria bacterium]|nr:alkene reductase [Gammaproteobacteria bacterium]
IPDGLLAVLRKAFSGNIIVCGGYNAERAQQALQEGIADLVAFGVPYLANPDLPARLENGWPLTEADQDTFYGGDKHGYTDYPYYSE